MMDDDSWQPTKEEQELLLSLLQERCEKICKSGEMRHRDWDGVYQMCNIFHMTKIMFI